MIHTAHTSLGPPPPASQSPAPILCSWCACVRAVCSLGSQNVLLQIRQNREQMHNSPTAAAYISLRPPVPSPSPVGCVRVSARARACPCVCVCAPVCIAGGRSPQQALETFSSRCLNFPGSHAVVAKAKVLRRLAVALGHEHEHLAGRIDEVEREVRSVLCGPDRPVARAIHLRFPVF